MGIWENTKNLVGNWFGKGAASVPPNVRELQKAATVALQLYEGNAPKQLQVKIAQPDDNIFINYPETIVEKGVSFLFGDELKISIGSDENKTGEDYLSNVWSVEQRAEDLIDAAQDGGIFGMVYLKIQIDALKKLSVIVLDPMNVRVETDPHNFKNVTKFINQYQIGSQSQNNLRWYKEEISAEGNRWLIREFESRNAYDWAQIGVDIYWNYTFAPVFFCKNLPKSKSFYGKPDLTKSVLDLCKYISRLDSLIGKIIRVHASPKPYARGMQKQDLQVGTEDVLFLGTNPEATLGLLEMEGDLAGALAFRRMLREALAEISKVPEVATGKLDNVGQLSGRALQILYGPLIDRTLTKRRLYGRMVKDLISALLEIGGIKNQEVKLEWSGLIPSDPKEEAETGILLKNCGYSEDTIIKRLGGDPVHEREMKSQETADLGDALGKAFNAGAEGQTYQN